MNVSGRDNKPGQIMHCPDCGTELPAGAPLGQCPKCLLKAAMGEGTGPGGTVILPQPEAGSRGLPHGGEQLGHYHIVRLLGAGGMGAVFEAEDTESGRRIALKILSHTIDLPAARERFLREGRLAASINHPNSVYVFGTEEVGGTPLIAMELVSGGTLQDQVRAAGPLPPGKAVDAVLQIIAGLEAAQKIGILHRDVKPSNCYCAEDGTVKIGDFGLSISTEIRTEPALTTAGLFLGTPAFCSPEQLRGDELNARSDMYSVGATLFYLLTGRTPFEGNNPVQLLATVLERPAPSPCSLREDIPAGLGRIVLRCLEKQPSERFKDYSELARALTPFSSVAPTPATFGLRFAAGMMDSVLLGLGGAAVTFATMGKTLAFMAQNSPVGMAFLPAWSAITILYYAFFESRFGATPGKAVCRLRVAGPGGGAPPFARALLRAFIFVGVPSVPAWVFYCGFAANSLSVGKSVAEHFSAAGRLMPMQTFVGLAVYALMALLFVTCRRRNAFAAVHDLASKTRVITQMAFQARPGLGTIEPAPATLPADTPSIGPYHILERLGEDAHASWFLGYDVRLLRKVWLRIAPPGTPPVSAQLRNIGRVGRLRWVTGRRSSDENWDSFEALDGKPLLKLLDSSQPWSDVRYWLHDLAHELCISEREGTLPAMLTMDRVWITREGRAKLLDFPAPGVESEMDRPGDVARSPREFLAELAARVTRAADTADTPTLLPLHARQFLQMLPSLASAAAFEAALKPLLQRLAMISRWRRVCVVAGCMAFPLVMAIGMAFGMAMMRQWNRSHQGIVALNTLLQERANIRRWQSKAKNPSDSQFAVYIASHYQPLITNQTSWNDALTLMLIQGQERRFAEQSLAEHPEPSAEEIKDAEQALEPLVKAADIFSLNRGWWPAMMMVGGTVIFVAVPAVLCAAAFRGGLILRVANITFMRRDGTQASRLRLFWRALLAWGPVMLMLPAIGVISGITKSPAMGLMPFSLVGVITIVSLALPERSLPDRLAGTWPVAR